MLTCKHSFLHPSSVAGKAIVRVIPGADAHGIGLLNGIDNSRADNPGTVWLPKKLSTSFAL
jgi:hypothetical protein